MFILNGNEVRNTEIYNGEYCVYVHISKTTGKKYIGRTKNVKNRWTCSGYKTCTKFYKAIQQYGWKDFEHEIVASNLTRKEADNFEDLLIKKFRTNEEEFGYNTTGGGQSWSGVENPNYGKHTLRKIYSENKKLAKEKQSRPGKQNGRAIPCELYYQNIKIGSFDYQSLAAQKFRELTGYNKKVIDCVLVSRMRRPEGYQGYKIIPLKQ